MPRALNTPTVQAAQLTGQWEAHLDDHIVALHWSPDGLLLAAAMVGGPVAIFDASGALLRELPGHGFGTMSISWSANSLLLASGGQDGSARIWEVGTGRELHKLECGGAWVENVAFSSKRDYLATSAGRILKLWSGSGELVREYDPHPSTISDISWQPDELFFATAAYGQLATYHAEKPEAVKRFEWKGSILAVAWSPDGNYLATGNQDASVHFWYRKSGRDLEMTGYPAKVREIAWDSGSRYLATGGSPVVTVWDCGGKGPAGTRPAQLSGHKGSLSALMFQSKGGLLASGCRKGDVFVWNHRLQEAPLRGAQLPGAVTQVRWSPDDSHLAAASETGIVRVFRRSEKE